MRPDRVWLRFWPNDHISVSDVKSIGANVEVVEYIRADIELMRAAVRNADALRPTLAEPAVPEKEIA